MREKKKIVSTEEILALRRNPDAELLVLLSGLVHSENPYYAWKAIGVCVEHKRAFPDWVIAYLGECSKRMLSDRAKHSGDLRKVLPWVLGFPSAPSLQHRKPGPGNLLDPDPHAKRRLDFALKFAVRLEEGEKPAEARRNACNDVFDGKDAEIDDRTLQRWLLTEFDLKKAPRGREDWRYAAREHYRSMHAAVRELIDKVSRDSDVTRSANSVSLDAAEGTKRQERGRCRKGSTSVERPD